MTEQNARGLAAVHDFYRARHRAAVEAIMARLTGKLPGSLSYEDVRWKLRARAGQYGKGNPARCYRRERGTLQRLYPQLLASAR